MNLPTVFRKAALFVSCLVLMSTIGACSSPAPKGPSEAEKRAEQDRQTRERRDRAVEELERNMPQ